MSRRLLAAAILAALTVPALAQTVPGRSPKTPTPQQGEAIIPKAQKIFPVDVNWSLTQLNGKPTGIDRPTLQLDGQFRVRGFGGCNTFSATAYPLPGQRFTVGPIAATKRACSKEIMAAEKAYLVAIRTAQAWDVKDGLLIIAGQAGELKFSRSI
jgi:heat shock protein HslJ